MKVAMPVNDNFAVLPVSKGQHAGQRSKCVRAPTLRMGCVTSAKRNIHWRVQQGPRSRVSDHSPYAVILVLLEACCTGP